MTLIEKFKIPILYHDFFEEHLDAQVRLLQKNIREDFVPATLNIFAFLCEAPPKLVVLGQDPYPAKGVANGIAFAASPPYPPTLEILRKAWSEQVGGELDCSFESWKTQGILMMNSSLTCPIGKPNGHYHLWKDFMIKFLVYLNKVHNINDFILLGKVAATYEKHISGNIIKEAHPITNHYLGKEVFKGNFLTTINETINGCSKQNN